MQPVTSIWYGVDPLTEEYASVSGYTYCLGNPIKLVDSDGKKPIPYKQLIARLRAINKLATFDKAWRRSRHGEKTVEEWGFVLTMTKNKRLILSRNLKTDHQDGSVVQNTKIPQNGTLIGDVHTHPYNKKDGAELGTGFSADDLVTLRKHASIEKYAMIVESGNKRYAAIISDSEKAANFFSSHSDKQIKRMYRNIICYYR